MWGVSEWVSECVGGWVGGWVSEWVSEEKREGLGRERLMLRLREVRVDVNCRKNINSYRHYTKQTKIPYSHFGPFKKSMKKYG